MDPEAKEWIQKLRVESRTRQRDILFEEKREREKEVVLQHCSEWRSLIDDLKTMFASIQAEQFPRQQKRELFLSKLIDVPSKPSVAISLEVLSKIGLVHANRGRTYVSTAYGKPDILYVFKYPCDHDNESTVAASEVVSCIKELSNRFTNEPTVCIR